ncbi:MULTISPECIES: tRNA pseudouridine(55) synthase TruB [Inquilinus]|uniref:tRNA pseudouridine synthase B n=1 Tax=Inquilinus ginsengisoli TaxID=363840 RepID=A0ABU1JYM2_9PROT|nr:tRNA pseudouridine(55) synthase TruB [Inquilinus ginsengisoli]MDR6293720.1 tRNA pseudouridine55 synthase [Inquilinus ginsengisoli]
MARKKRGRPVHGWVVVDKPVGVTSTQVVGRIRRLFDAEKAGHAGTLDPLASGILPIALGEATKTVSYAMDGEKTYRFTVRWGEARDTDDTEGKVTATSDVRPDPAAIAAIVPRFIGEISQVPPAYSAIKVDGERAYDLARSGETVELAARLIRIDDLRLAEIPDADHATFDVQSGKGAYMRGLARDIALALGTVGHIVALRRTRVGPFGLDASVPLAHIDALAEQSALDSILLPIATPLDDIPAVALTEAEAHRMRHGQPVALLRRSDRERIAALDLDPDNPDAIVLATCGNTPVALARIDGGEIRPVRILNL